MLMASWSRGQRESDRPADQRRSGAARLVGARAIRGGAARSRHFTAVSRKRPDHRDSSKRPLPRLTSHSRAWIAAMLRASSAIVAVLPDRPSNRTRTERDYYLALTRILHEPDSGSNP